MECAVMRDDNNKVIKKIKNQIKFHFPRTLWLKAKSVTDYHLDINPHCDCSNHHKSHLHHHHESELIGVIRAD